MTKLTIIFFALLTAIFETVGANGSTLLWDSETSKSKAILLIILGFGGSVLAYIMMRKYVVDLVLAQSIFIAGTALFALVSVFFFQNNTNIDPKIIIGIVLIAVGAVIVNNYLPE